MLSTMAKLTIDVRVMFSTARILYLPELIQFYWKDFGGSFMNVCSMAIREGSAAVQADVQNLLRVTSCPKVIFTPYDWNACLVIASA